LDVGFRVLNFETELYFEDRYKLSTVQ
jgi:hypothetical protein